VAMLEMKDNRHKVWGMPISHAAIFDFGRDSRHEVDGTPRPRYERDGNHRP
jgi:hypothetical protein